MYLYSKQAQRATSWAILRFSTCLLRVNDQLYPRAESQLCTRMLWGGQPTLLVDTCQVLLTTEDKRLRCSAEGSVGFAVVFTNCSTADTCTTVEIETTAEAGI